MNNKVTIKHSQVARCIQKDEKENKHCKMLAEIKKMLRLCLICARFTIGKRFVQEKSEQNIESRH